MYVTLMSQGDHIKVFRGFYWHHGIDTGTGTVVHQTGEPGRRLNAAIQESPIKDFLGKGTLVIENDDPAFDPVEVLGRARSKIGSPGYGILFNNCEHFAQWCRSGRRISRQVDNAAWTGILVGIAARVGGSAFAKSAALHSLRFLGPVGTTVALTAGAVAAASRWQREK